MKNLTKKPLVIPVFTPHLGCPHRCSFCNQSIITNEKKPLPDSEKIRKEVDNYLKFKGKREKIQLAFFGGTFLGLNEIYRKNLLDTAEMLVQEKKIHSIRFSTRPDTITKENLDSLKNYSVATIELGVQSMNDQVLASAKRGHSAEDTRKAASLLREYGFETGMQMMAGLPEDTDKTAIETAEQIASLSPDFVRIYPLVILKGSLVHKLYQKGEYKPLSLPHCVTLVKKIYLIFKKHHIPVIRMGLQASELLQDKDSMIAGPWHPAFGHLVFSEIFLDKVLGSIKDISIHPGDEILLQVNPRYESRLRGNRNQNIKKLNGLYPGVKFTINTDVSLRSDQVQAARFNTGQDADPDLSSGFTSKNLNS